MYVLEMLVPGPSLARINLVSLLGWGVAQEWLKSGRLRLNSSMPGTGAFVFVCDFEKVLHSFACISRN